MPDSPRWCETCKAWGDHHTDRCPATYDAKSVEEQQWDMMQTQRRAMGQEVKPYPGDAAAQAANSKKSSAVSAKYPKGCRKCGAEKGEPCRSRITRRGTDTHRVRIEDSYPNAL